MLSTIRIVTKLVVAVALSVLMQFTPLFADPVTYISSTGFDANPCTAAQPCTSLADAIHNLDMFGGQVSCLNSPKIPDNSISIGGSLSVTIDCTGTYPTSFANSGAFVLSGNNLVITIRNLTINGRLGGNPAIAVFGSGSLVLENCVFEDIGRGPAIDIEPNGAFDVVITNSRISNSSSGVLLKPSAGGGVNATFDHVLVESNVGGGIRVDGTGGGPVKVAITDSSISLNGSNGVNAVSGPSGNVRVNLIRDVIASNGLAGVQSNQSNGGSASVTVSQSTLSSNGSAWSIIGGATLLSYQNNEVTGTTGTPPSPASFQ